MNMRKRRKHCANILAKEFNPVAYKQHGWTWLTSMIRRKCIRVLLPA